MRSVYEASSGLDAHMILDLLRQQRISGSIEGEYLQGGVGGIQAMGLVRVLVSEEDYPEAKEIIDAWESVQPALERVEPEVSSSAGLQMFVAGILVGASLMYWLLKVH